MTKMIVGLGNPGEKYETTRHNMGFMTLDLLAQEMGVTFTEDKTFSAAIAIAFIQGEKIFLVKPLTYMNESGRAIKPLLTYYNLELEDLIVVVDDMDSPTGRLRMRQKGSSGGQRGIKSLITHLGGENWKRIKIGIGRPKAGWTVVNHVLSRFEGEEVEMAHLGIRKAADAILFYLDGHSFENTMSQYNDKK